jgi:CubicO group peptidase (beta-lactamase class C family)
MNCEDRLRRRQVVSLLGGAALPSLAALPVYAVASETCVVPIARDDGWPVAAVNDDRLVDRGALCAVADRLAASSNVHAVLVARAGKLAFERYFRGTEEIHSRRVGSVAFDADTLHDVKSVSKSVASLAFGIAMDRGLIGSIDQPIFSFFPELSDLRSAEKDRIKLSHVLTMSMGLTWEEATPATGDDNNDEARMNRARDPCRFVLGLAVTDPAGHRFFYNTGALALLSAIMRKATGQPLDEFARANLFEPLGISAVEWKRVKGNTDAGGGLRLRPRDMAKIGQLVLAGGRWNDRQIVSRNWTELSTAPQLEGTDNQSYGYLWWLGLSQYKGRKVQWIAALGRGGQSIRIVPQLDLVVVVTAGYYQDYSASAFQLQYGIFKDVLQAIETGHN